MRVQLGKQPIFAKKTTYLVGEMAVVDLYAYNMDEEPEGVIGDVGAESA